MNDADIIDTIGRIRAAEGELCGYARLPSPIETPMNLTDIIKSAIREAGGDALINEDIECGCSLDDFMPCGSVDLENCKIAKGRVLGPDEGYVCEAAGILLGPGDTIYDPIEVAK